MDLGCHYVLSLSLQMGVVLSAPAFTRRAQSPSHRRPSSIMTRHNCHARRGMRFSPTILSDSQFAYRRRLWHTISDVHCSMKRSATCSPGGKRMPEKILRLPNVLDRTGLSRSTVYLRVTEGRFPRPVSLGARAVGWIETEIEEWIARQITISREIRSERTGANALSSR